MSAGTRPTITRNRPSASGSADVRWRLLALSAILTGVAGCVVQPRMVPVPNVNRTETCRSVVSASAVHVTWVLPEDPDRRGKLDLACAGVGPVVVQAGSGPSPDGSADPLIVLSWNTYLGRGNLAELVSRLQRGEFTSGSSVRRFALLLQEVYRTSILEFARERGLHVVYAPARRRDGDSDDRGGAILSTSPLDDIIVVELPFEKQRRVTVGARLESIGLINVHVDTSVGIFRGGPGAARRRQARALIQAVAGLPSPLLVAGDFNTWWGDDEPAVKDLLRAFPDAKPVRSRETWRGPLGTGNRLDYVFAKGIAPALTVVRLDRRFGSDHWPLMTVIPE
jgi:endonuclease/exonuclease/phosphatase family metal-dependent hydrolase